MYWDQVLKEVLYKGLPHQNYLFTSINDSLSPSPAKRMPKKKMAVSLPRQKFYLGSRQPGIYFTSREVQTIQQIIHGKNVAQAAMTLGMSHRTVEFYLYNMRNKLNCRCRKELIAKIRHSDLSFLFATNLLATDTT